MNNVVFAKQENDVTKMNIIDVMRNVKFKLICDVGLGGKVEVGKVRNIVGLKATLQYANWECLEKIDAREVLRGLIGCRNGESEELKNVENELKVEILESTEV